MSKESVEFWDKRAESYEHFYTLDTQSGKSKAERKYKMILEGIRKHDLVLELGCGTGLLTSEIAKIANVYALDQSKNMVAIAKRQVPDAIIEVSDVHQLNYLQGTFDAVVGSYIIQYLNLDLVLPEIYRVLKYGGYVAFTTPNALNPLMFLLTRSERMKMIFHRPQLTNSYSPMYLMNKFRCYGFNNVKVIPTGFTPTFIANNKIDEIAEKPPIVKWLAGNLLVKAQK